MAFFDSPKNKALWDKELENLDAERERRKEEGYKPRERLKAAASAEGRANGLYTDNPKVRRITLKELEEIEKRAREAARESGGMTDAPKRQRAGAERSRGMANKEASAAM